MVRSLSLLLICMWLYLPIFANETKKVNASYTYYAPESMSIEDAKRVALDRAKTDAIEKTYGSHVSQLNITSIENSNGNTNTSFSSYGGSEIRGEWIETITEPTYDIKYIDNILVVSVSVRGIIREIKRQQLNLDAHLLKNGTELQNESYEYFSGDEMYLLLNASSSGFLIAYLLDDQSAYRLLPYRKQKESCVKIDTQDPILFFHKQSVEPSQRRLVDEYILTSSKRQEINYIYLIFSTNDIYKAIDYQLDSNLPRELSCSDFHRWLGNARRQDEKIIVKELPITIRQK